MVTPASYEEMITFFEGYADFIARMARSEHEKLQALISNELARIEQAISAAQANAMQLENLEQNRQRLQERAGCAGMSFTQIIEAAPEEEKTRLQSLFERIQGSLEEIKRRNGESMDIAGANMRRMKIQLNTPKASDPSPASAYIRVREETGRSPMLETKV